MSQSDDEFIEWLKSEAPRLRVLLTLANEDTTHPKQIISHLAAENLPQVYPEEEIAAFMKDEVALRTFVQKIAESSLQLGMFAQRFCSDGSIWLSSCGACNTPYDNGGCTHEGRPPPSRRNLHHIPAACNEMHRNVKLLAALAHLLGRDDCQDSMLVRLVVPEPPVGVDHITFCAREIAAHERGEKRGVLCILQMLALVDNASTAFPKAAMYAAAALSLAVCRCPSKAFILMDAKSFCGTLSRYFEGIYDLVTNNECSVEEAFGVVALNNILPLMYWMADWKKSHPYIVQEELAVKLVVTIVRILHQFYVGVDNDVRYDHERFPELRPAVNFISCLQTDDDSPLSWAVGAACEVLARWANRGIPVSTQMIPTNDGGNDTVSVAFEEYLPRLDGLSRQARRIVEPIMSAFAANKIPDLPELDESFLGKPLSEMIQHCAYCGSSSSKKIFRCTGGCKGLACYCSPEHQRAHWKIHRIYCKVQKWD